MKYPSDTNSTLEIANNFNKFFTQKINKIVQDVNYVIENEQITDNISYDLTDDSIQPLSHFTPLSEDQVQDIIKKSKNKQSYNDPIPIDLLKNA